MNSSAKIGDFSGMVKPILPEGSKQPGKPALQGPNPLLYSCTLHFCKGCHGLQPGCFAGRICNRVFIKSPAEAMFARSRPASFIHVLKYNPGQ